MYIVDTPIPEPRDNEVRIKVICAGVNRPDILQKKGLYPPPIGASSILGLEASGIVEKVGKNVASLKCGDEVCGLTPGGAYAEFVTLPAIHCLRIPKGLTMYEAAALPEAFMTAWVNLFEHGQLTKKERVLIHGGSSGVGTAAIQLAKWKKTYVFSTVRNEVKANYCTKLGADKTIIYPDEDFEKEILSHTKNCGVNLILDMVGGDYISKNIKCLSNKGRLVQIAFLKGSKTNINLMRVMLKKLVITGSTIRSRTLSDKARILNLLEKKIWPVIESGEIKVKIYKKFKLEEVEFAHQTMESSTHCGKIVLNIDE